MKKNKLLFLICMLFFSTGVICAKDNITVDNTKKIYDYAQVLTSSEEQILKEQIDEFIKDYNMDMVIVSVKYHQKTTTREYASDFYDYNNFGLNNTKDGILFVLDFTFGKEIEILTTGNSILMYDDTRINNMLDNIASKNNDSDFEMFNTFIKEAYKYANMGYPDSNSNIYLKDGHFIYFNWTLIITLSIIIPTGILIVLVLKNKMVKVAQDASVYIDKKSLNITSRNDRFITTHTTSTRINDSSSGTRAGGSSISRGSSGTYHGGGGRKL